MICMKTYGNTIWHQHMWCDVTYRPLKLASVPSYLVLKEDQLSGTHLLVVKSLSINSVGRNKLLLWIIICTKYERFIKQIKKDFSWKKEGWLYILREENRKSS